MKIALVAREMKAKRGKEHQSPHIRHQQPEKAFSVVSWMQNKAVGTYAVWGQLQFKLHCPNSIIRSKRYS